MTRCGDTRDLVRLSAGDKVQLFVGMVTTAALIIGAAWALYGEVKGSVEAVENRANNRLQMLESKAATIEMAAAVISSTIPNVTSRLGELDLRIAKLHDSIGDLREEVAVLKASPPKAGKGVE